jgi:hypothetical protein
VVGAVLVVLAVGVYVAARLVRKVFAWLFLDAPAPAMGSPMMIIPSDAGYAGPVYRARFYDGTYEQLTDIDITIGVDLSLPGAEGRLAAAARQLAAQVEARDSQRCFRPRLVLLNGVGRPVREWSADA